MSTEMQNNAVIYDIPVTIGQNASENDIVNLIFQNRQALHRLSQKWPGADIRTDQTLRWAFTDLLDPFFNCVYHTDLSRDEVSRIIPEILKKAKQRYINIWWLICPWTKPENLSQLLMDYGFQLNETTGMALDLTQTSLDDTRPARLKITRINDDRMLDLWCQIALSGFGMPLEVKKDWVQWYLMAGFDNNTPFDHFIAWQDKEPVATASLFRAAGVAGIYNVATVPAKRQRGIGATLMKHVLHTAKNYGYRLAILQSSEQGKPLYHKLGFREYCQVVSYFWIVGPPEVKRKIKTTVAR